MSNELITWIANNPFGVAARNLKWVFSTCETVHFIGLCILFGALLMFDLRMLGFGKSIPARASLRYTGIAGFGLGLNIVSGLILFSAFPGNYASNPAFQLKMLLLVLGLLNVAWFEAFERDKMLTLPAGAPTPLDSKIVAGLSLFLWTAVLILGRWLPITATGGG